MHFPARAHMIPTLAYTTRGLGGNILPVTSRTSSTSNSLSSETSSDPSSERSSEPSSQPSSQPSSESSSEGSTGPLSTSFGSSSTLGVGQVVGNYKITA